MTLPIIWHGTPVSGDQDPIQIRGDAFSKAYFVGTAAEPHRERFPFLQDALDRAKELCTEDEGE